MIKFRAWNKVDKFMTVPLDIQLGSDGYIYWIEAMGLNGEHDEGDLDVFELEQFTGLKDVNGNDIYVGDIIKFFGANKKVKTKNEFGIIVYKADRYGAGFNSIIQNKEHGYGGINIAQDIVVGNVHENPELLKG